MKAKELAAKLLENPDFEVLILDFDNVKPGERILIDNMDWKGIEDENIDVWRHTERIYLG